MGKNASKVLVSCSVCSKEKIIYLSAYEKNKTKTFFCSEICQRTGRTIKTECGNCFKPMTVAKYRLKDSKIGKVFCSIKCANNYKIPYQIKQVTKICSFCGKEIKRTLSMSQSKKIFCDANCYFEWNRINKPLWNHIITNCGWCGKEFKIIPSYKNRQKNNFCGKECYSFYCSKRMAGESNPNWHGGMRESLYGSEFNERLREYVRDRFNRKCAWCGVLEELLPTSLQVHHINYLKTDNNPDTNLIPLCHQDHSRTNGNRTYWTNVFTFLMAVKDKQERLLTNNL